MPVLIYKVSLIPTNLPPQDFREPLPGNDTWSVWRKKHRKCHLPWQCSDMNGAQAWFCPPQSSQICQCFAVSAFLHFFLHGERVMSMTQRLDLKVPSERLLPSWREQKFLSEHSLPPAHVTWAQAERLMKGFHVHHKPMLLPQPTKVDERMRHTSFSTANGIYSIMWGAHEAKSFQV